MKQRSGGRVLAFFAGLSLFVAVAGAVWYFVFVKPVEQASMGALERVERFLGGLLGGQGTVTVNQASSILKVSEVAEMALMEYETQVVMEVESEDVALHLLTSKKSLRMSGRFKVKVGYDISSGLELIYDENGQTIINGLGKPKVLSAEMISVETLEENSGFWNKVTSKDRDQLTNQLRLQAIRDVKGSGLLEQLDTLMKQQFKVLLGVEELATTGSEILF